MNKIITILPLWMGIFFTILGLACNFSKEEKKTFSQKYTCPMHPQIVKDAPDICPVCHMDLIPLSSESQTEDLSEIHLTARQKSLANIRVDTVHNGVLAPQTIFTGVLNINQKSVSVESARISGRIDRLYFKTEGVFVAKGVPLYDLYSEALNNAKQEYKLALEHQLQVGKHSIGNVETLVEAARYKLKLWGMTDRQIEQLAHQKEIPIHTTIYSMHQGYITSLAVTEGAYVSEQDVVMELAQMSTLWAEAQVYTSQLAFVKINDIAMVSIPDLGLKEIKGKINFENPEMSTDSRINLLRVEIPNSKGLLRAGMPAFIAIKKPAKNTLTLPVEAVIRNGDGATVWLQTPKGTFKNIPVQLGVESDFEIEIVDGLKEGDAVVTSGAYLLNSEYIFKNGADPMSGMHLDVEEKITKNQSKKSVIDDLIVNYLQIQQALSSDKSGKSYQASQEMHEEVIHLLQQKDIEKNYQNLDVTIKKINVLLASFSEKDIELQRKQFKNMSDEMYHLIKGIGSEKLLYRQYCPMANAYWISDKKAIINPYFGAKMLTCGETKETIR